MGDHLVLCVDRLITPSTFENNHQQGVQPGEGPSAGGSVNASNNSASAAASVDNTSMEVQVDAEADENMPLLPIPLVECRICQEEDHVKNLDTPCACCGSLKYAHRKCLQRWCNEKGDTTCEICHEPYKPGYTAPANADETTIDLSGGWTISGSALDLNDPRILAMAAAERHFLEAEYDEYGTSNASGAAFCRSAALILMALLLLRHALNMTTADGDEDASTFFSLFLLRAAAFLLPCYIMAWAFSILQRRRQRQEAAALAATEVAFVLQSGQRRGLQFTVAPAAALATHQEPV